MADQKTSGLPAVAGFAAALEFPVNDAGTSKKITGTQILAALPQGTLAGGYAEVSANQGSITTQVDLTGLTVTVTPGGFRRIRLSAVVRLTSTVANDQGQLYIMEGGTQLAIATLDLVNTARQYSLAISFVFVTTFSGVRTFKLQAARVGTGTMTMQAGVSSLAFIHAEDVGV